MGFWKACRRECSLDHVSLSYTEPRDFVTLQFGPRNLYPVWTVLWSLYHLAWCLALIITVEIYLNFGRSMAFLTNWGYGMMVAYQFLDTIIMTYIYIAKRDILEGCNKEMHWYLKISWVLYTLANCWTIVIVISYWMLIGNDLAPKSISKHILTGICVLLNACFTAKPVRLLHFYQPILVGVVYLIFTAIYQFSGGGQIYTILDWTNPGKSLALSLPLVLVAVPLSHVFFYVVYRIRKTVRKYLDNAHLKVKPAVIADEAMCRTLSIDNLIDTQRSFSLTLTPNPTQRSIDMNIPPVITEVTK